MKKLISAELAGKIVLITMSLLILVHILTLTRVVPFDFFWGGQIKDPSLLIIFETIALITTFIFTVFIAIKIKVIKVKKFKKGINFFIWTIFAYFILNSLGNISSKVFVEKLIFAPITIVLAFLVFRLAIERN